ncbi:MAG: hypothetical protein HRT38_08535 [Alteromonadaceae bacterium]|nr:hypothetical protein [Alteromonadaceae bacterium]
MNKHLIFSILITLFVVNTANAGLISGNINDTLPLPTVLALNSLPESNTEIFLYTERQDFSLPSDLSVDFFTGTASSGVIAANTRINSFFINFDAVGTEYTENSFNAEGSYLFDTEILGVIWGGYRPEAQPLSSGFLDASDSLVGLPGIIYGTSALGRGLEPENFFGENTTQDVLYVLGPNNRRLDLSLFVKPAYADQLRVITAVAEVPVPATLLLFGPALLLLINLKRRK